MKFKCTHTVDPLLCARLSYIVQIDTFSHVLFLSPHVSAYPFFQSIKLNLWYRFDSLLILCMFDYDDDKVSCYAHSIWGETISRQSHFGGLFQSNQFFSTQHIDYRISKVFIKNLRYSKRFDLRNIKNGMFIPKV